jgi:hypothetical protein
MVVWRQAEWSGDQLRTLATMPSCQRQDGCCALPSSHRRSQYGHRPWHGAGTGCGVRCALQPVVLTGISLCDVCSRHEILRTQRTRVEWWVAAAATTSSGGESTLLGTPDGWRRPYLRQTQSAGTTALASPGMAATPPGFKITRT